MRINETDKIFCVLDNRSNHENRFSIEDIKFVGEMVANAGIRHFYGATVTPDTAYNGIVKLASANLGRLNLEGELIATDDYDEAELFVTAHIERINRLAGR
ncbi:MAG: hypothetical protein ACMVY4_14180 [Minwuia sp.]|uniref:hypothetical protein n=1 Tax=Minwuia sp. TaxID=2493630 RepID=UPI003A8807F1